MNAVMSIPEITCFLGDTFPQIGTDFVIESIGAVGVCVRLRVQDHHLRPGGTVSGPSMFALADVAMDSAVLSRIGPQELAVTANCAIDFMRRPTADADLICDVRLLKVGRVLAVGDALLRSEGHDAPVARANLTYAIPPE